MRLEEISLNCFPKLGHLLRKWLERETFNSFHFKPVFLESCPKYWRFMRQSNLEKAAHNTEENWITKKVSVKIKSGGQICYRRWGLGSLPLKLGVVTAWLLEYSRSDSGPRLRILQLPLPFSSSFFLKWSPWVESAAIQSVWDHQV